MLYKSFGETLKDLREKHGVSQHRLGLLAQVSPSNIGRMEKGARGIPEPLTLLNISDALELDRAERKELIIAGLSEAMKDKVEQFAIYLYLFLGDDMEMWRRAKDIQADANANRPTRDFLVSRGEQISDRTIREMFIRLADDPVFDEQRQTLAPQLISHLMIDLKHGEVGLRLGPIAEELLAGEPAVAAEESSASA